MFLGTHSPRLDDKGRLTLPAKFRDELAGGLVVAKGQDHTLEVWPREAFREQLMKLAAVSRSDPTTRAFLRHRSSGADEQRLDSQGRISLSGDLRSYAHLTKECVVNGAISYLEIWDSGAWQDYAAASEEQYSEGTDPVLGDVL